MRPEYSWLDNIYATKSVEVDLVPAVYNRFRHKTNQPKRKERITQDTEYADFLRAFPTLLRP